MFSMVLCCCFCSLRYLSGSINLLLSSSLYSAKSVAQFAFEEMISTASETDSDISLSDFSDSSSDEDTPLPPPLLPERGRGVRTRGGRVRTRGGQQRPTGTNPRNNWLEWIAAPFTPVIPPFTGNPGPTITLPDSIKDYVHLFISDELIYDIVNQTNLYADEFLANAAPTAKSRSNEWKPVTNL